MLTGTTMRTKAAGGSTRSTEIEDDVFRSMDLDSKELTSFENDEYEDYGENSDVAREGIDNGDGDGDGDYEYDGDEITQLRPASKTLKKKYLHAEMLSYKQQGSYDIPEDVYAFITVAPVCSAPFLFAIFVIGIKYVVYLTLLLQIDVKCFLHNDDGRVKDGCQPLLYDRPMDKHISTVVKFFLIPVTVAMQEDLMAVYAGFANARYDDKVIDISADATKTKFALAYILQLIDGLLSLSVNFLKMFNTPDILNVFLNFAALHFLQDIDDVFYALVEKGFFGDDMEHMAMICKQISWPRRAGTNDFQQFMTNMDSILFFGTFFICVIVYFVITIYQYKFVPEES
jgi:hypothetical protein